jgi:7-cyano-7-deazaguanine synthase
MRALVLHSGGLDSTVCLGIAMKDFNGCVTSLGINYGQRHLKELHAARIIAEWYHIDQDMMQIDDMPKSMLTDPTQDIPEVSYAELPHGISPTFVPFRNGQLLSKAAAKAQAEKYDAIYFGAHSEDAQNWAYPDCTPEFIGAMANAIHVGTYHKVRLHAPLMWCMKSTIVRIGMKHQVPFALTWSCYAGGELHCGICPTCRSRKAAFKDAGFGDPTEYAE